MGGLIKSALWRKYGDTIHVSVSNNEGISRKPNFSASVKLKDVYGIENGDIGIGDLNDVQRFVKKSSADTISLSLEKFPSGEVAALKVSADGVHFRHQTQCVDEFKTLPLIKPDCNWDAAIVLDDYIKEKFPKAHSALGNDSGGLFTVAVSKRTNKLCIAFGYSEKRLCDSIRMSVSCVNGLDTIKRPVAFEAVTLKRILKANPEFKDPVLYVSEAGFASIDFSDNELDARYVLKEIEVED